MKHYNVLLKKVSVAGRATDLFVVGFGDPAQNDQIVRDAEKALAEVGELGGQLALINGPASLPVAVVLSHGLVHRYEAVGVFDPKLSSYVVSAAHGGGYSVGDLIPAEEVRE